MVINYELKLRSVSFLKFTQDLKTSNNVNINRPIYRSVSMSICNLLRFVSIILCKTVVAYLMA